MKIIRAIIDDFKEDGRTLKGLWEHPERYHIDWGRITTPKMFILFMLLAFLCGTYISAIYYQKEANEVIMERCQYIQFKEPSFDSNDGVRILDNIDDDQIPLSIKFKNDT